MEIKNCAHCGGEPQQIDARDGSYFIHCKACGVQTNWTHLKGDAVDAWNSRIEQDSATIDRWFKEATEQRARADKSEEMVAFLKEQLARVANFNCDWDMLKACQESWRELASEHNKLKKECDELTEALEHAKRMLDYAGKMQ